MVGILLKVMHPGVRIPPLMPSLRFDLRDLRRGCECRRAVSYKFEDLVNCNP